MLIDSTAVGRARRLGWLLAARSRFDGAIELGAVRLRVGGVTVATALDPEFIGFVEIDAPSRGR